MCLLLVERVRSSSTCDGPTSRSSSTGGRGVLLVDGIAGVSATSEAEYGISTGLIACAMRDRPVDEALAVLQQLLAMNAPIIGLGLDSTEIGNPPEEFAGVYDAARAAGLHVVAHVGEEGPPAYISQALNLLHIERIDHGVRCLEDPSSPAVSQPPGFH